MSEQDLIRELAKLLDETGLTEIEVEREGVRVRVARQAMTHVIAAPGGAYAGIAAAPLAVPIEAIDPGKHPGMVASPMVGTAYRAPAPGAKPFVDVGSVVKAGDTLLVVEARRHRGADPVRGRPAGRIRRAVDDRRVMAKGVPSSVMAGLVPVIHVLLFAARKKTWMPGTRPGMTKGRCVMD